MRLVTIVSKLCSSKVSKVQYSRQRKRIRREEDLLLSFFLSFFLAYLSFGIAERERVEGKSQR